MPNRFYVIRTALIVALGGFLMGFDASVISGVVGFIETEFSLTKAQLGFSVASLTLTSSTAHEPSTGLPQTTYIKLRNRCRRRT